VTRALVVIALVVLGASRVVAQPGPIARSIEAEAARAAQPYSTYTTYSTQMRSPAMYWAGIALVIGGAVVDVGALTWAQQSDLSHENPNTRLGRDLAPCGTDPAVTRLPIADCTPHTGLLVLGSAMAAGGGVLIVIGGQTIQITQIGPRAAAVRWRF